MKLRLITILAFILIVPHIACGQSTYGIKSHEILFEGTSNIQSWTAEVKEMAGSFTLLVENGKINQLVDANVNIDAGSIEGSEGRRMDSKIYEALDIKNHPQISFLLREVNSLTENPGTFKLETRGVLTVAGVSRNIPMIVYGKVMQNGDLEFSGSQKILMSDHRISPPTALLGALKTGDEIMLSYKVVLNKK
ncbi:MAG: YceI family protein [Bacteroidales bacterium]